MDTFYVENMNDTMHRKHHSDTIIRNAFILLYPLQILVLTISVGYMRQLKAAQVRSIQKGDPNYYQRKGVNVFSLEFQI